MDGKEEVEGAQRSHGGKGVGHDYSNMTLALRECPDCGRHGQVMVMQGEVVVQIIPIITREEARTYNAELVRRGGKEQESFLAQVAEATYLLDEESQKDRWPIDVMVGGMLLVSFRPGRTSGQPNLQTSDLSGAVLKLERCSCGNHGMVVLELPDGQRLDVAAPKTKFEACQEVERLLLGNRTFPEQPEFVQAVREAEWLQGAMPVEL